MRKTCFLSDNTKLSCIKLWIKANDFHRAISKSFSFLLKVLWKQFAQSIQVPNKLVPGIKL